MTPELKTLLKEKKRIFRSGDKEELRRVQKELKREIRRGKDAYRRKLEERLQQNNVWRGLEKISGHNKSSGRGPESGDLEWANELNLFFNRFDSVPTPSPNHQSTDLLPHTLSGTPPPSSPGHQLHPLHTP